MNKENQQYWIEIESLIAELNSEMFNTKEPSLRRIDHLHSRLDNWIGRAWPAAMAAEQAPKKVSKVNGLTLKEIGNQLSL